MMRFESELTFVVKTRGFVESNKVHIDYVIVDTEYDHSNIIDRCMYGVDINNPIKDMLIDALHPIYNIGLAVCRVRFDDYLASKMQILGMDVPRYCTVMHYDNGDDQKWHITAVDNKLGDIAFDKLKLWDAWGMRSIFAYKD